MKKILLTLIIAIGLFYSAQAQFYDWNAYTSGVTNKSRSCVDADGNLYILCNGNSAYSVNGESAGITTWSPPSTSGYADYVVSKFNPTGHHLWSRAITIFNSADNLPRTSIYADKEDIYILSDAGGSNNNDSVTITLKTNSTATTTVVHYLNNAPSQTIILSLNSNGFFRWSSQLDGEHQYLHYGKIMSFSDDYVLIAPRQENTNPGVYIYTKNGVYLGLNKITTGTYNGDIYDVQAFRNSSSYVVCTEQAQSVGAFMKYDKDGNLLTSYTFTGGLTGFSHGPDIYIDAKNNIYAIGNTTGSGTFMSNSYADGKTMLIKLDSNLNPIWAKPFYSLLEDDRIAYSKHTIGLAGNTLYIHTNRASSNDELRLYFGNDLITNEGQSFISLISRDGEFITNYTMPNSYDYRDVSSNPYTEDIYLVGKGSDQLRIGDEVKNVSGTIISKLLSEYGKVEGKLYRDLNSNNIFDASDRVVKSGKIEGNGTYYMSLSDGNYIVAIDTGETSIMPQSIKYYNLSPSSLDVDIDKYDTVIVQNFAYQPISSINDLEVYLTNLTPARLGSTIIYRVTAKNTGTTELNSSIVLSYDNRLTFEDSGPSETSHSSDDITWDLNNFTPGDEKNFTIRFTLGLPPSVELDDILCNAVQITPVIEDTTEENNKDTLYQKVIGAYDPNIKETNRPEIINVDDVNSSFAIDYTIHFQNTGNDTAFHVYLIDSLDVDLKVESIEVLSASHDYEMSISENNTLRWDYYNILLVDSNTNEPMSHGFVKYRVYTKDNPDLGDEFTNFADIYFDFNAPIRTNTTSNRIDKIESVELVKGKTVIVYPNPTTDVFTIKVDIEAGTTAKVEVIDLTGKLVSTQTAKADTNGLETQVDINTLPQGIYFVKVYAGNAVYTAKVVKQ